MSPEELEAISERLNNHRLDDGWSALMEWDVAALLAEVDRLRRAFGVDRVRMLDLWMALGGGSLAFEEWMDEPKRSEADAWSQLLGAVRGDLMLGDHNPGPGDALLDLIWKRA